MDSIRRKLLIWNQHQHQKTHQLSTVFLQISNFAHFAKFYKTAFDATECQSKYKKKVATHELMFCKVFFLNWKETGNATTMATNSFLQALLPVATFCKKTQTRKFKFANWEKRLLSDIDELKKAFTGKKQKQYKYNKVFQHNSIESFGRVKMNPETEDSCLESRQLLRM